MSNSSCKSGERSCTAGSVSSDSEPAEFPAETEAGTPGREDWRLRGERPSLPDWEGTREEEDPEATDDPRVTAPDPDVVGTLGEAEEAAERAEPPRPLDLTSDHPSPDLLEGEFVLSTLDPAEPRTTSKLSSTTAEEATPALGSPDTERAQPPDTPDKLVGGKMTERVDPAPAFSEPEDRLSDGKEEADRPVSMSTAISLAESGPNRMGEGDARLEPRGTPLPETLDDRPPPCPVPGPAPAPAPVLEASRPELREAPAAPRPADPIPTDARSTSDFRESPRGLEACRPPGCEDPDDPAEDLEPFDP